MATRWAEQVLATCLCLKKGESVLALTDEPLRHAGEALCASALQLGARSCEVRTIAAGPRLSLVPASLLAAVERAGVIVSLHSTIDLTREDPVLRAAVAAFRRARRGRWAFGAFLDEGRLDAELAVDYGEIARCAVAASEALKGAESVRITAPNGTDLSFRLGGRPIHRDSGILDRPGAFGNIPAGEVYTAPLEDSAEGRLVVDLCVGDLKPDVPIALTFRGGQVVAVEGGAVAAELQRRLGDDPWAWTIGEFGIGVNPRIVPRGRASVDEKAAGTIHIALGGNDDFGGVNPAATHYDCVVARPQVYRDGALLRLPVSGGFVNE